MRTIKLARMNPELVAQEIGDFTKSLDARHTDPAVKASVHKSLKGIPDSPLTTSVTASGRGKLSKMLDD